MLRLTRLPLTLCLLALAACGGSSESGASATNDSGPGSAAAEVDSFLSVTLGGTEYRSQSRVKEQGIKFGERLDAFLIADSMADPSGVPEVSISISAALRETGTFEIVFNQNKINRELGSRIATVKVGLQALSEPLEGLSGTLTISTLDLDTSGKNYSITRMTGSFEGSFRAAEGGDEQAVQGSFDYAR